MLIRAEQASVKPSGVPLSEFGLGEIERAWQSVKKPRRSARRSQMGSLVGSSASYEWRLDATEFPTLFVPTAGCEWSLFPLTNVQFERHALLGETDQAVDIALEHLFNDPVILHLGWEERFKQAQYAEIVEDPCVRVAMQKWQDEEAALRNEIRHWLADLQAST